MNTTLFSWLAIVALAVTCWACSAETVNPQSKINNKTLELQADGSPHPELLPVCSPKIAFPLSDPTGNLLVNYTGTGPTGQPSGSQMPWGEVIVYNGMDQASQEVMAIDITLASGWYIRQASIYCGDESFLQIGPNGVPLVNSSWTVMPVNPVINSYQIRVVLDGMATSNALLARLEVGMLDWTRFDGSLDQNSITELWAWNAEFNNGNSPLASSSPLLMPYTTSWCNPPVPQDLTLTGGTCSGCDAENTVTFKGDCKRIDVSSCKDLSNVVLVYEDCSWQKFDGLTQKSGTFAGTGSNDGKFISHVYIKSGCHKSGEGPGFGRRFDGPCVNLTCQATGKGKNK